ncbi:MAG: hypothetical protein CL516_04630 [Actinobacteria bacterium]|nr:hypothetical protein [Actinomycetota bacterium]MBM16930.1 hypothetical protein [Actinomycetota bacterium]
MFELLQRYIEVRRGFLTRGGTMLDTSRVHPWLTEDGAKRARATLAEGRRCETRSTTDGQGTAGCP